MDNESKREREKLLALCDKLKTPENSADIAQLEHFIRKIRYGLNFERHAEAVDEMLENNIPIFEEHKELMYDKNSSDCNFLLEGDNLHSLKLLQRTHYGAIDVIYIDPPYNTENQGFTYNDKMVGIDDGYRHSKWLSFMKARLEIARDLLNTDGLIFISIDDNEYANLKLLCDSIFTENNFICSFIWRKTGQQQNNGKNVSVVSEYIICYAKELWQNGKKKELIRKDSIKDRKGVKAYSRYDEKNGNYFRLNPIQDKSLGKHEYTLIHPISGKEIHSKHWRITKEKYEQLVQEDMIFWTDNLPNIKKYLDINSGVLPNTIIDGFYNEVGNQELQKILGPNQFTNPKPVELIKKLISFSKQENFVVLDFFAGSGTTGQAVLELNQDGGNRKFILCTNNENNICEDITYKRLETVITGVKPDGTKYSDGIPANLKYLKAEMIDKNDIDLEELLYDASEILVELENMKLSSDNKTP